MNLLRSTALLITSVILSYPVTVMAHTTGEHGGGLMQQVLHILQSADHLFIILALGVVVSLLLRRAKQNQDK